MSVLLLNNIYKQGQPICLWLDLECLYLQREPTCLW